MRKTSALLLALMVLLSAFLAGGQPAHLAHARFYENIVIRSDGTIEGTTKIQRTGNVYTFTDNIAGSIVVERDNIVIDGAGYTLSANKDGIELDYRRKVTVKNLVVTGANRAFDLTFADDNTIIGNTIIDAGRGIYFWFSWRNKITENTITNADYAFDFYQSPNHWSQKNVVTKNTVLDSSTGLRLMESNNIFSDNVINASSLGVSISGHQNLFRNNIINCTWVGFKDTAFDNDIDETNLVNGKPIIYWIGHKNEVVPSDAGYVVLSRCENIKVQSLRISDVALFSTTNSLITRNRLSDGEFGIKMVESSNNTIKSNSLVQNSHGIELTDCNNNEIVGNNVSGNLDTGIQLTGSHYNKIKQNIVATNGGEGGIKLLHSSNNHVIENNISGNRQWGIRVLGDQHDNIVYHNNFIENKVSDGLQVSMMGSMLGSVNPSDWDDGTRGNYWSDYLTRYPNASEIGNTEVGDTPFYINPNNTDHYPLMKPYVISELPYEPESSTASVLVAAVAIIAIVLIAVGVGVYSKKRKRRAEPS